MNKKVIIGAIALSTLWLTSVGRGNPVAGVCQIGATVAHLPSSSMSWNDATQEATSTCWSLSY